MLLAFDHVNSTCSKTSCCKKSTQRGAFKLLVAYHDQVHHALSGHTSLPPSGEVSQRLPGAFCGNSCPSALVLQ